MRMINGTTAVCGLVGNPVSHSISPLIHNNLAEKQGLDMAYVNFCVEKEKVGEAVRGADALSIRGLNVTVPHKQAVMPYLKAIDPAADAIGAVNTLVRTEGGFKGYNTDFIGFERECEHFGVELAGKIALLLGAGGAARAVAFACADMGAKEVVIFNRTQEKAADIADAVNKFAATGVARGLAMSELESFAKEHEGYVLVQTTSVGLHPHVDEVITDLSVVYDHAECGVDIIYNPETTKFMKLLQERGKKAYNGLTMLLYQGVASFELWNDVKVSRSVAEDVLSILEAEMGRRRAGESAAGTVKSDKGNLVLTGFMGSGKTTFGMWLAQNKGYMLLDTDAEIEKEQGRAIKDIFATDGEEAFRDMETEFLKKLNERKLTGVVLSVGGGMPVREENRALLKSFGKVVYLKAEPDELVKRLTKDTTRPLLAGKTGAELKAHIETLMGRRESQYLDGANQVLETAGLSFEDMWRKL